MEENAGSSKPGGDCLVTCPQGPPRESLHPFSGTTNTFMFGGRLFFDSAPESLSLRPKVTLTG